MLKKLANHSGRNDTTFGYVVVDIERLREPMQKITMNFYACAREEAKIKLKTSKFNDKQFFATCIHLEYKYLTCNSISGVSPSHVRHPHHIQCQRIDKDHLSRTGNYSQFVYDGLGRGVEIIETTGGAVTSTTQFVQRSGQILESRDASGALLRQYFSKGFSTGELITFMINLILGQSLK